jgi:hypothetical protein
MSGLLVGFVLVTVLVGWVLHPIFAGHETPRSEGEPRREASPRRGDPLPDVESEIAMLRARLREGRACARCGAPTLESDRFCGGCGSPTGAGSAHRSTEPGKSATDEGSERSPTDGD